MIRSMTGYGRVQQSVDGFNILIEIKSVNHRYFDFSGHVPRLYGYIEEKFKAYIQNFITRGKVDVFVAIDTIEGSAVEVLMNYRLAGSYIAALNELRDKYNLKDEITVSTLARYSDIFTVLKSPENEERVWGAVRVVADAAIKQFMEMREAEGGRLGKDIAARADYIQGLVEKVEQRSPVTVEEYRSKLKARMMEILADSKLDESRILLEAALYADKVSVNEETVRLKSHLKQFAIMLDSADPVGRKIDFLMQEINREANTIGSKAYDIQMAGYVVEIKAELEKIREQIQNIE
jgi:uncharacterized protein (TIGR00255 family)